MWCSSGTSMQLVDTWLKRTVRTSGSSLTRRSSGWFRIRWTLRWKSQRTVHTTGALAKRSDQCNIIKLLMICIYIAWWFIFIATIPRIVVHGEPFLKMIEPLSAQPFNFPKEFHLTEAQVSQIQHLPLFFCNFISLNFGLSVIGFGSEWSLPHRGGSQDSEIRDFHKKQQSFMSSAYTDYPECLSATADDHMNTNQPQVDYWPHLDEDFTLLLRSWAHTDPQLFLQNVLLICGCEWILCFTASCNW